jgi:hypothetical protein
MRIRVTDVLDLLANGRISNQRTFRPVYGSPASG